MRGELWGDTVALGWERREGRACPGLFCTLSTVPGAWYTFGKYFLSGLLTQGRVLESWLSSSHLRPEIPGFLAV